MIEKLVTMDFLPTLREQVRQTILENLTGALVKTLVVEFDGFDEEFNRDATTVAIKVLV